MGLETFLLLLLVISTLTGLTTEALKELLTEWGRSYKSNTLACASSVVLSLFVWVAYAVLYDTVFNAQWIVYMVALMIMSWLSSMLGYDKVMQTISQLKTSDK